MLGAVHSWSVQTRGRHLCGFKVRPALTFLNSAWKCLNRCKEQMANKTLSQNILALFPIDTGIWYSPTGATNATNCSLTRRDLIRRDNLFISFCTEPLPSVSDRGGHHWAQCKYFKPSLRGCDWQKHQGEWKIMPHVIHFCFINLQLVNLATKCFDCSF